MATGFLMSDQVNLVVIGFFVTALFGGFAGSFLTLFYNWSRRPILRMIFNNEEDGCVVTVGEGATRVNYLRIKIRNVGILPAENVTISVTTIHFVPTLGGVTEFREEVLDFKTAMTGENVFRIPGGGHRFVDCYHVPENAGSDWYGFDFHLHPARLFYAGLGVGTYSVRVFASANGAASLRGDARWTWDGTFSGLKIVRFSEG
jgi:hypothetical protein